MRKKFIYVLWALVACVILAIAFIFTAIAKGVDWLCSSYRGVGESELEVCNRDYIR